MSDHILDSFKTSTYEICTEDEIKVAFENFQKSVKIGIDNGSLPKDCICVHEIPPDNQKELLKDQVHFICRFKEELRFRNSSKDRLNVRGFHVFIYKRTGTVQNENGIRVPFDGFGYSRSIQVIGECIPYQKKLNRMFNIKDCYEYRTSIDRLSYSSIENNFRENLIPVVSVV